MDSTNPVSSFAIIFWQILSRETEVYQGYPPKQIIQEVTTNDIRPLNKFGPQVFQRIIDLAWDQNPEVRPTASKITEILAQPVESILSYISPDHKPVVRKAPPPAEPLAPEPVKQATAMPKLPPAPVVTSLDEDDEGIRESK